MGLRGVRVQNITTEFEVKIKFPEKSNGVPETDLHNENGQTSDGDLSDASPKPCDVIRITGT